MGGGPQLGSTWQLSHVPRNKFFAIALHCLLGASSLLFPPSFLPSPLPPSPASTFQMAAKHTCLAIVTVSAEASLSATVVAVAVAVVVAVAVIKFVLSSSPFSHSD